MILENILSFEIYNNTGTEILVALATFFSVFIILKLFELYVLHRIKALAKRTKNDIDDVIVEYIEEISWTMFVFISFYISSKLLTLPALLKKIIHIIVTVFIVYYVVKFILKIIDFFIKKEIKKRHRKRQGEDTSLLAVLNLLLQGLAWIFAGLMLLSNFGVDVTSLIAGLGIGGIAIAFALQNILEDIFSSFSIYFDKPFKEGDFIIIGDDLGTVKKIGLKTTRIEHLKGQELVVSNKELTSTRIHNYKKMKKRRIAFSFGVEYGTPVKKLKKAGKIVKKIIDNIRIAEIDRVHFHEFGDFSLNFEVVYYLDSREYNVYMDTQQEINLKMIKEFEKQGIEFAFPTQTIHLKK
ncbi:mechanosensitive ion channel [Candidatus Woesearchaeota archaeon]|nr:mechanosensitive ion channel [Candidatus Woesearchaeota archaeon]